MTKVFVWKNYGEVNVYAFETVVQQSILTGVVHKCARSNAIDPIKIFPLSTKLMHC